MSHAGDGGEIFGGVGCTRIDESQRAMATLLLARHDGDDLITMLGLDQPAADYGLPPERLRPIHHTDHVGRIHARRLA